MAKFVDDGLIVAAAAGSTAYNLSAQPGDQYLARGE
jgi:NAD kinase